MPNLNFRVVKRTKINRENQISLCLSVGTNGIYSEQKHTKIFAIHKYLHLTKDHYSEYKTTLTNQKTRQPNQQKNGGKH